MNVWGLVVAVAFIGVVLFFLIWDVIDSKKQIKQAEARLLKIESDLEMLKEVRCELLNIS